MNFGDYLRRVRLAKDLTAGELGRRVNTTGQYITQTERGKLKAPNKEMAYRLASALEINPAEIWRLAALERYNDWCIREGIDPAKTQTFFQAARYDKKMASQKIKKLTK